MWLKVVRTDCGGKKRSHDEREQIQISQKPT